jgi:tRNA G18 (ribose-2'-O)-methylase SpoU
LPIFLIFDITFLMVTNSMVSRPMDTPNRIRQCQRPRCRFRFPIQAGAEDSAICPKCGGPARLIEMPTLDLGAPPPLQEPRGPQVEVLLDNIRSTFNVGSILRTAEGAGVRHIYFCGITPTPDHPKIAKTALGAEQTVSWSQHWNAMEVVSDRKQHGIRVWALEGGADSCSIFNPASDFAGPEVLLVLGNEVSGIDREILPACDQVLSIPMMGQKRSLNVATAFGIAIYTIRFR